MAHLFCHDKRVLNLGRLVHNRDSRPIFERFFTKDTVRNEGRQGGSFLQLEKVISLILEQETGMGHCFLDEILPEPDVGINNHGSPVQIGKRKGGAFFLGMPFGKVEVQ